jgi:hypothetical protein
MFTLSLVTRSSELGAALSYYIVRYFVVRVVRGWN